MRRPTVTAVPFLMLDDSEVSSLVRDGEILACRRDGLFGRLLCFVNALRLAEVLGCEMRFLWDTADRSGNRVHGYSASLTSIVDDDRIVDLDLPQRGIPQECTFSLMRMALLPGEDPDVVAAHLQRLARGLSLVGGGTLEDLIGGQRYALGMHVRAGDAESLTWLGSKFLPLSVWLAALDRVASGLDPGQLFVATNDPRALGAVDERYPGLRAVEPRPSGLPAGVLADAFADVIGLCRTSQLVCLPGSAMASFALLVSGAETRRPGEVLGIEQILTDVRAVAYRSYVADVGELLAEGDIPRWRRSEVELAVRIMTNAEGMGARPTPGSGGGRA